MKLFWLMANAGTKESRLQSNLSSWRGKNQNGKDEYMTIH